MTRRDADVGELASAFGLGALPYRSFRNPPVRSAPLVAVPAAEAPKPREEIAGALAVRAMAEENHAPPPALRVISSPPPERDAPAAAAPPAGPAQVIAWPAAAMQALGASTPGDRGLPAGPARNAPEPLPLVLAVMAEAGVPAVAVREPPGAAQPANPIEFPLLATALGLAAPQVRPPPSPEARRTAAAATAGEYPLLHAVLGFGGRP